MTNPSNESSKTKIEMIHYWEALVMTGPIKGASRDRLYQEIGLESLADKRWSRKIFFFHKVGMDCCSHTFSHI